MNRDNINTVIDWLKRGAPETVFSMRYSLHTIDETDLGPGIDPEDSGFYGLASSEQDKVNAGCGSVCCIGGAAAQFDGLKPEAYQSWADIQERALKYFGIPVPETIMWMLPVFDPDWAPDQCSPQEAAYALELWASQDPESFDINFNPWEHM